MKDCGHDKEAYAVKVHSLPSCLRHSTKGSAPMALCHLPNFQQRTGPEGLEEIFPGHYFDPVS